MKLQIPPTVPANHPARLGQDGVLFIGRARNLSQRLDALDAIAAAKVPSQQIPHLQDIDADWWRIWNEAVQVAAMAMRMAIEGDASVAKPTEENCK